MDTHKLAILLETWAASIAVHIDDIIQMKYVKRDWGSRVSILKAMVESFSWS